MAKAQFVFMPEIPQHACIAIREVVTSHNTLVTYTDKNSEPMLTRSNLRLSNSDLRLSNSDLQLSNSEPLDKLCPVLSLVTHPDNPWFQVLSCTLWKTLTNSEYCHTPCHTPLSHTLG